MWGVFLFAAGMAALGFYLLQVVWRYLRLRTAMRRWPRVPARVVGYRTELGVRSRRVDVQVRYDYDGRAFEVWSGSATRGGYSRDDVQAERQVAATYPRGTSHQVFVNPERPEEAFLEPPEPHLLAMISTGAVLLIGIPTALLAPVVFDVDPEVVKMMFMLVLAAALSLVAVFAGIALLPSPPQNVAACSGTHRIRPGSGCMAMRLTATAASLRRINQPWMPVRLCRSC